MGQEVFKVLAVTKRNETQVESFPDRLQACEFAMSKNKSPYSTLYIVEDAGGCRMPVIDQQRFLTGKTDWWTD